MGGKPLGDGVKRPVIIVSGGLDGYKEELALLLQGSLAGSGVANGVVLVLADMPGTGQNPRPLSVKGNEEYSAIIDRLASEPDIDSTRIGFMGLSFGGYWAVRLPQVEPRIKAAVNFGGPMTKAFTLSNLGRLPDAFVQAALLATPKFVLLQGAGTVVVLQAGHGKPMQAQRRARRDGVEVAVDRQHRNLQAQRVRRHQAVHRGTHRQSGRPAVAVHAR